MSVLRLTNVADNTRASKEYWDKRCENLWGKQFHGHFLDDPKLIEEMDNRNFDVIENYIIKFAGENKTLNILECACGVGRYAPKLEELLKHFDIKMDYIGQDIADLNISEAKKLYEKENVKFVMSNMLSFTSDKKFDIIFMVAAMSSIEQSSQEIVDHLKSMLAPGGVLCIFEQGCYYVLDNSGVPNK